MRAGVIQVSLSVSQSVLQAPSCLRRCDGATVRRVVTQRRLHNARARKRARASAPQARARTAAARTASADRLEPICARNSKCVYVVHVAAADDDDDDRNAHSCAVCFDPARDTSTTQIEAQARQQQRIEPIWSHATPIGIYSSSSSRVCVGGAENENDLICACVNRARALQINCRASSGLSLAFTSSSSSANTQLVDGGARF